MADTIKKCTLDVYVKDGRLKEVEEKFDRIKDLFSVELKYGSSQGKQYMVNPGKWLEVVGKRENAVKARVSEVFLFMALIFGKTSDLRFSNDQSQGFSK